MKAQSEILRQLPDLNALIDHLESDRDAAFERAFPPDEPGVHPTAPLELAMPSFTLAIQEFESPLEASRKRWLDAGLRGLKKIHAEGGAVELEPDEIVGLEAIVHIEGRPALLVQNGSFGAPPFGWQNLEAERARIEQNLKVVGRIEVNGHLSYQWVGTGFLVAEDVVMTNRHVAEIFCRQGRCRRWEYKPGMSARIDYAEEYGASQPAEYELTAVIGVHKTFDMALFRAARSSSQGAPAPQPLAIASRPPSAFQGHPVYTIGYPAWDGHRNDPEVMLRIFSNIFNVKRLQPGEIMNVNTLQKLLSHDCSTLGGNSGSCVIDLATHQVIGLHFGGSYLQGNRAVCLWQLTNDALLKKAKVNFV